MKPFHLKKITLSIFLFSIISINASAASLSKDKYKKLWKEVENFEKKRLTKSALEKVEIIFSMAVKENNEVQIIKSISYRLKYIYEIEEDGLINCIQTLEKEIIDISPNAKVFLNFLLGNLYIKYFDYNSHNISKIEPKQKNFDEDIYLWSEEMFYAKIISSFDSALEDKLKAVPIGNFKDIIINSDSSSKNFPTLYDAVAFNIIESLNSIYPSYWDENSSPKRDLESEKLVETIDKFIEIPSSEKNTNSIDLFRIKVFQKWLNLRLSDKNNLEALIHSDIQRLNYYSDDSNINTYKETLLKMQNKHKNAPEVSIINYNLADFLLQRGDTDFNEGEIDKGANKEAMEILTKTLTDFPEATYAKKCRALVYEIEKEYLKFTCEETVGSKQKFPIRISYKNIDKVYLSVLSYDKGEEERIYFDYYKDLKRLKNRTSIIIDSEEINLPKTDDYNLHSTEYLINKLAHGSYYIFLHSSPNLFKETHLFTQERIHISDLCLITYSDFSTNSKENEEIKLQVLNRSSGKPEKDVSIKITELINTDNDKEVIEVSTYKTDKQGSVIYEKKGSLNSSMNLKIEANKGTDYLVYKDTRYNYYGQQNYNTSVKIFTDRHIYRPGQTVNFKAICTKTKNKENIVALNNYKIGFSFKDVNNNTLETLNLTTNEFGSVSGTFTIPAQTLNGEFNISTRFSTEYIRVEEYKRPKFELNIDPIKGDFRANDSIEITGRALSFAGTTLTDAKLKYSIKCSPDRYIYHDEAQEIDFGEAEVDNNGNFKIKFIATPPQNFSSLKIKIFRYTADISLTDINGETQHNSTNILISDKALNITNNIEDFHFKENTKGFSFFTKNIAGEDTYAELEIEIFRLKEQEILLADKKWQDVDMRLYSKEKWYKQCKGYEYSEENNLKNWEIEKSVFKTSINTKLSNNIDIENITSWQTGAYRVIVTSLDKWGNKVFEQNEFTLISSKSKRMPYKKTNIFKCENYNLQPGDTARIFIGSSYKDTDVYYTIRTKANKKEYGNLNLDNSINKIEIPITEVHRGGFSIQLFFVKDGNVFKNYQHFSVDWNNKKLNLELITFRDKTMPGSQENWKLKILDNENKTKNVEVLASMYDKSLSIFGPHKFEWSIFPTYYSSVEIRYAYFNTKNSRTTDFSPYYYPESSLFYYPSFNLFESNSDIGSIRGSRSAGICYDSFALESLEESPMLKSKSLGDYNEEAMNKVASEVSATILSEDGSKQSFQNTDKPRKNFNETAFFYPMLSTNEDGEVLISFIVPESLTTWNFNALAHSQDLEIGYISKDIICQKDLMILPNLPRFFRENDKIRLSTKINNISLETLEGKASIEFFDPSTQKNLTDIFLIDSIKNPSFKVETKGNTVVSWDIAVPEGLFNVGIRITAKSETHSDGEEHIIPILSNKKLITETLSISSYKKGETKFSLNKLKNNKSTTLRNYKYSLELTPNPIWQAIQALPYIMEYPHQCSEQTFSKFYSNTLASNIVSKNPQIEEVFKAWKSAPNNQVFLSNLEKNQELKSIVLEETPWILDSKDEALNKQRLAMLFDKNKINYENNLAINRLVKLQNSDGGISWFEGMQSNPYITRHILCGFGHLSKVTDFSPSKDYNIKELLRKGITYIDREFAKDYKRLKNQKGIDLNKDHLDVYQIHYLYTRSFYKDLKLDQNTLEAFNYFLEQSKKYWTNKSEYMQAMIALNLSRIDKNDQTAKDIIKSLKERAIESKDLGMYWKQNASFFWHQAPIETQALLIEAFSEIDNDKSSVNKMKIWLLKQKQVQNWPTTKSTTEAIYALLLNDDEILSHKEQIEIKIGDIKIDTKDEESNAELGTSYIKKSWEADEIKDNFSDISIRKSTDNISFGAIYWQYFEELNKISLSKETPLTIDKQISVERIKNGNKTLIPVEDNSILKIGDRIKVRILIKTDRNMDYIHLKDMRASCFEPSEHLSGYKYKNSLGYYQDNKDASINFFIDSLNKGSHIIEYDLIVSQKGEFSNGVATIQSMYSPEFSSHSSGLKIFVE